MLKVCKAHLSRMRIYKGRKRRESGYLLRSLKACEKNRSESLSKSLRIRIAGSSRPFLRNEDPRQV